MSLLRRKPGGRIELSAADGAANPYLCFALLIYAGADGVEQGLSLPEAPSGEPLPSSLAAARALCRESAFLRELLPREILRAYAGV